MRFSSLIALVFAVFACSFVSAAPYTPFAGDKVLSLTSAIKFPFPATPSGTGSSVSAPFALSADGFDIFYTNDNTIVRVGAESGDARWSTVINLAVNGTSPASNYSRCSAPTLTETNVVVACLPNWIVALSQADGSIVYQTTAISAVPLPSTGTTSPLLNVGIAPLYFSAAGRIVVAGSDAIFAVVPASGLPMWQYGPSTNGLKTTSTFQSIVPAMRTANSKYAYLLTKVFNGKGVDTVLIRLDTYTTLVETAWTLVSQAAATWSEAVAAPLTNRLYLKYSSATGVTLLRFDDDTTPLVGSVTSDFANPAVTVQEAHGGAALYPSFATAATNGSAPSFTVYLADKYTVSWAKAALFDEEASTRVIVNPYVSNNDEAVLFFSTSASQGGQFSALDLSQQVNGSIKVGILTQTGSYINASSGAVAALPADMNVVSVTFPSNPSKIFSAYVWWVSASAPSVTNVWRLTLTTAATCDQATTCSQCAAASNNKYARNCAWCPTLNVCQGYYFPSVMHPINAKSLCPISLNSTSLDTALTSTCSDKGQGLPHLAVNLVISCIIFAIASLFIFCKLCKGARSSVDTAATVPAGHVQHDGYNKI